MAEVEMLVIIVASIATGCCGTIVVSSYNSETLAFKKGEPKTLSCLTASQSPAISYLWKKNDEQLSPNHSTSLRLNPSTGSLTIESPNDDDAGTYQCFLLTQHGTAIGTKTVLQVASLQPFSTLKDQIVHRPIAGSPLKLQCKPPASYPAGDVYWGMNLPGPKLNPVETTDRIALDYDGNLYFAHVSVSDGFDGSPYVCIVDNQVLRKIVQGSEQRLMPVVITATPKYAPPQLMWSSAGAQVALKGLMAKFKCIFSGFPTPRVTWKRLKEGFNAVPLPQNSRVESFGQELVIHDVEYDDAGEYVCSATNADHRPQTSNKFSLIVESLPFLEKSPSDLEVPEDEDVAIPCFANGVPHSSVIWLTNGKPIQVAPDGRVTIQSGWLNISRLMESDTQVIQCNASNSHGYVLVNAYLNVRGEMPSLIQRPESEVKVAEDHSITLTCRAVGGPLPVIIWQFNSTNITNGTNAILHRTGDLEIKNLSLIDNGNYTCQAVNKYGSVKATATVIVRGETRILDMSYYEKVRVFTNATLNCLATTDLAEKEQLSVQWYNSSDRLMLNSSDGRISLSSIYPNQTSLHFTPASMEDSGKYSCVASNGLDTVTRPSYLLVQDRPEPPVNVSWIKCDAKRAVLSWNPGSDNNEAITDFTIYCNTTFDSWGHFHAVLTTNETLATLSLLPWRNYSFHVRSRNRFGFSDRGALTRQKCESAPDKPYSHPSGVCTRSRGSRQLVIVWQPMTPAYHNGDNFHYIIKYRRLSAPMVDINIVKIDQWRQKELVIENQPTFASYEISVEAANSVGIAPEDQLETFIGYSGEDVPLTRPTGVHVMAASLTSTGVVLVWDSIDEDFDKVRGFFRGYQMRFWRQDDPLTVHTEDVIVREYKRCVNMIRFGTEDLQSSVQNTHQVHGQTNRLWPYSVIHAVVMVINGGGQGPPSELVEFCTPEGPPGPVASFSIDEIGSNHVRVSWLTTLEPNGIVTGYVIRCEPKLNRSIEEYQEFAIIYPASHRYLITRLQNDTEYEIHIWPVNSAGRGTSTVLETVTLPLSAPDIPVISKVVPGKSFLVVTWLPSFDSTNPGNAFYVEYCKYLHGSNVSRWKRIAAFSEELEMNLTNLDHGQTYEIRVVASNSLSETTSQIVQIHLDGGYGSSLRRQTLPSFLWWLIVICIIIFLVTAFILLCAFQLNRHRKISFLRKKDRTFSSMKDDEMNASLEFGQITKLNGNGGAIRHSTVTDSSAKSSDSDDSEYGDTFPDAAKFNEDGSFIGQYCSSIDDSVMDFMLPF